MYNGFHKKNSLVIVINNFFLIDYYVFDESSLRILNKIVLIHNRNSKQRRLWAHFSEYSYCWIASTVSISCLVENLFYLLAEEGLFFMYKEIFFISLPRIWEIIHGIFGGQVYIISLVIPRQFIFRLVYTFNFKMSNVIWAKSSVTCNVSDDSGLFQGIIFKYFGLRTSVNFMLIFKIEENDLRLFV